MTPATTQSKSEYDFLVESMLTLHDLIRAGQCDGAAADDVRDQMDHPWTKLTDDQRARIDGMSADLYTLGPDSPIRHADKDRYISAELSTKLGALFMARKWDEILTLLRESPEQISWDLAAQYRAEAYAKLGEEAVAKRFLAEAWRLNPQLPDLRFVDAGIRGIFVASDSTPPATQPSTL
jgi:hypothetical protein